MKKFITYLIFFVFLVGYINISNADFFENTLELKYNEFNIKYNFYELKNYKIKNKKYQKQYYTIKKINPFIKKAIIKKYKNNKFSYYKTNALVNHYNNFIYNTNKYFEAIKLQEKFGVTIETNNYLYTNFINMKSSYYKFINILKSN